MSSDGVPSLSVCLVVKDEAAQIAACLESIRGLDAEIVVVHDGPCSDGTLEIARRYTSRVFVHAPPAYNNDPLIPFALEQTSGEWVLQLDADERITEALRREIPRMLARTDVDAYALFSAFHNPSTGLRTVAICKYKKILLRRAKMYKVGIPHAQSGTYGKEERSEHGIEHHVLFSENARKMFFQILSKNVKRSQVAADLLCGPRESIPVFNCSMHDRDLRIVRKLSVQRRHPLVAFLLLPLYSFYQIYIRKGRWRWGVIGCVDSLNVPLFHARTCLCILRRQLKGEQNGR